MYRFLFIFSLFFLLVSPKVFAEQPVSVAILNLEGDNVDKELVTTLSSIVRHEAQQIDRYQVVNKFEINFQDVLLVLGCDAESTPCLKQAAEQVNAQVLIFGRIARKNTTYQLSLNLFDSRSGKMLNKLSRTINARDEDPVVLLRKEIEGFFSKERAVPTTRLQIGSNVSDARILIEDTFVGNVPLERKGLPPGRYKIEVNHPDYVSWETVVELKEGSDINLWAPLKRASDAVVDTNVTQINTDDQNPTLVTTPQISDGVGQERVSSTNWGAWSAIGVGSVALAGSGVFAYLMGGVEDDLAAESAQRTLTADRYNELNDRGESYQLTHRVLLGVGAACVVGGVIWLIAEPGGETATASVGITPGGVAGTLTW
ncbi:MAG: PEGA domain-containing protein [bacterium]